MRKWVALWALLLPASAFAAGFEIPDNGTRALGRGAAFTAVADDGAAIEYNPAGLAQQDGLQLTVDANWFMHHVDFLRTDATGGNDSVKLGSVSNSAGAFFAPMAALSYGHSFAKLDRFTVALGVYGPPAEGEYRFPSPGSDPAIDAPNRYQLIHNDIFIAYPGISIAYKLPIPGIFAAIGVNGQMVVSHFQFEQDLYTQPTLATAGLGSPDENGHSPGLGGFTFRGAGVSSSTACKNAPYDANCHTTVTANTSPTSLRFEDPIWDADVNVDVTGKKAFTAVLGALVKAGIVAVGVSYRPGYHLHADGTLDVKLPGILTAPGTSDSPNGPSTAPLAIGAKLTGNQTALDLDWPSIFRAGVDVEIPPVPGKLDLSADFTYETWGVVDKFTLTPQDVTISAPGAGIDPMPLAKVEIPKHMQNTQSYRFGAGYELPLSVVKVETRLGAYYEKSASPEPFTTIDLAHFDRFAVTAGASIGLNIGDVVGPLMLDVAALYSPPGTREVRDSQENLTASDQFLQTDAVGNGNYTSSVLILSAGLRAHFGL